MHVIIISLNFNYDQLCFIKNKIVFFMFYMPLKMINTLLSFENPFCMGNITGKKIYGFFAVVVV